MAWMETGLFEGVKLHELETPWMQKRQKDLEKVLSFAEERVLPVMFHASPVDGCRPSELAKVAFAHLGIRFNFAHCCPMDEMAKVIADCPNVWTDTAYMGLDEFRELDKYDWHGRLMFGTDFPVWQSKELCGLTTRYREYTSAFAKTVLADSANTAFQAFRCGDSATCKGENQNESEMDMLGAGRSSRTPSPEGRRRSDRF